MNWNVILYNPNSKTFEVWDVFAHGGFAAEVKEINKRELTPAAYSEAIKRSAKYYFASKCEYEVVLFDWPRQETSKKISIFDQLEWNWDTFLKACGGPVTSA